MENILPKTLALIENLRLQLDPSEWTKIDHRLWMYLSEIGAGAVLSERSEKWRRAQRKAEKRRIA